MKYKPGPISKSKGFTLVELVVYVGLFAIVLLLMVEFILNIIHSTIRLDAKEEVHKNAAAILRSFEYIARDSSAIYTPTSDFVSDPGQLSLVTNVNVLSDENEGYADFYVDGGKF